MNLQLVIVPTWLDEALKSVGASDKMLLDPLSLMNILSKADVAFYMLLNNELRDKVHPYLINSFEMYDLFNATMEESGPPDEFLRIYENSTLEHKNPTLMDLYGPEALATEEQRHSIYERHTSHSFEIKPIHDNVMGLYLKAIPGMSSGKIDSIDVVQTQLNAIDRAIKQMLTYISFERISRTPIFTQFTRVARYGIAL
jgi:hypothetical protein